ncbi:MAG: hypothetical protein COS92_03095 [Desulfobacterales bacterium CG07_land_8_20_14_0_80_52_14]|nr:MAG: hypothetical protein COS92_03095 [Desulfobacterales bacterium CG07_land_8_20_14_0_80_52_14]
MRNKRLMGFRFKGILIGLCAVFFLTMVNGCLSYRILREAKGNPVALRMEALRVGSTTMGEALAIYGAPSRIAELKGRDLLVYERSVFSQNSIAFGIPITDFAGSSISFSGYTNLTRYDTLVLVFTTDGILEDSVFEQGSALPYLETLFKEEAKRKPLPDHKAVDVLGKRTIPPVNSGE